VQGQKDANQFSLSIWDSLFQNDRETVTIRENQGVVNVKQVKTKDTKDT